MLCLLNLQRIVAAAVFLSDFRLVTDPPPGFSSRLFVEKEASRARSAAVQHLIRSVVSFQLFIG